MSTKYVEKFTDEDGKEAVRIMQEGHINSENISHIGFIFDKPSDITDSLDVRNSTHPNPNAPKNDGRVAHASIQAQYPDGETSSKMVVNDCIIHYRENALKEPHKAKNVQAAMNYGKTYVQVGIPTYFLDKVFSEALRQSIKMGLRERTPEKNGYYWVTCDISRLNTSNIFTVVDVGDDTREINDTVRNFLNSMESSLSCTITLTVSCSTKTATRDERIDLAKATYHPTIRPFEVAIESESDVEGPQLSDISIQNKNEVSEKTERNIARGKLAEKMMQRLKIGN